MSNVQKINKNYQSKSRITSKNNKFTFIAYPAFLEPGEPHGQRGLMGCGLWGCKESDTTKQQTHTIYRQIDRQITGLLACSLSPFGLFVTPWTTAHQVPLSIEFPRKHTGAGCHFLLQGIFLTQGLNPRLLDWQEDSLPLSYLGSPDNRIGDFYFLYTFLYFYL